MRVKWISEAKDTPNYGLCEPGRELEVTNDHGKEMIARGLAKEIKIKKPTTEDDKS